MGNPADPVSALTGGLTNSQGKDGGFGDWIGDLTGANAAARAAGDAAKARERELQLAVGMGKEGLEDAKSSRDQMNTRATEAINAAKSPQELNALTNALGRQERALAKQEQIMAQIDPAILEASQQALQLLRGEEARSIAPLREQRQRDRQKLVDNLREQMGSGAETSTAGMQALNQFDQQTSQLMAQTQESALGGLFGMGMQGVQGKLAQGQLTNQGIGQIGQIGQAFGQSAGRVSGATLGALQGNLGAASLIQGGYANLMNAQQGLAAGAGSQYVESQLRNQAKNQFINDRIQAGENMAASAMGSGGAMMGCFPGHTLVDMANGSRKSIKDIKIGDRLHKGGLVLARMEAASGYLTTWFDYEGVIVSGEHAVMSKGKWLRVEDAPGAFIINEQYDMKYNLVTENHTMHIGGVLFADMQEADDHKLGYKESLEALNATA